MTLKYGGSAYKKALASLGLTVYKRIDPEGSKWGLSFGWSVRRRKSTF